MPLTYFNKKYFPRSFTLVEIMIVVAIIALFAAISIPGLLRARMYANQAKAQATLRTISTALEIYATVNEGLFPNSEANWTTALVEATPPYVNKDYIVLCDAGSPCQGYVYEFETLTTLAYNVTAQFSGAAGEQNYTITTNGVLRIY